VHWFSNLWLNHFPKLVGVFAVVSIVVMIVFRQPPTSQEQITQTQEIAQEKEIKTEYKAQSFLSLTEPKHNLNPSIPHFSITTKIPSPAPLSLKKQIKEVKKKIQKIAEVNIKKKAVDLLARFEKDFEESLEETQAIDFTSPLIELARMHFEEASLLFVYHSNPLLSPAQVEPSIALNTEELERRKLKIFQITYKENTFDELKDSLKKLEAEEKKLGEIVDPP